MSAADSSATITQLLQAARNGDTEAFDRVMPLVYDELRRIARGRLRGERSDHTLRTTGLVHEAFLKLADVNRISWQSRAHFFAVASRAMRRVLVDYAVRRNAQKRGGGAHRVTLDDALLHFDTHIDELLTLDEALQQLEQLDARQARVVECRFFGGLSIEETAHVLDTSPAMDQGSGP